MVLVILILLACLFLSSCSYKIVYPYEERKSCETGRVYGVCGSISDVYEESIRNPARFGGGR